MSTSVDTGAPDPLVSVFDLMDEDEGHTFVEEGGPSHVLFLADIAGPYDWFKDGVCEAPTSQGRCARPAGHSPDMVLFA